MQNFTKIAQTVAEISNLTFFKMAAIRHRGFLGFGGPICVSVRNFVEIGQTVAEIYQFILFFKMAAVRHYEFVGGNFGTKV